MVLLCLSVCAWFAMWAVDDRPIDSVFNLAVCEDMDSDEEVPAVGLNLQPFRARDRAIVFYSGLRVVSTIASALETRAEVSATPLVPWLQRGSEHTAVTLRRRAAELEALEQRRVGLVKQMLDAGVVALGALMPEDWVTVSKAWKLDDATLDDVVDLALRTQDVVPSGVGVVDDFVRAQRRVWAKSGVVTIGLFSKLQVLVADAESVNPRSAA